MKLIHRDGTVLVLPNDLLWQDEFEWSPVSAVHEYALNGTLLIEESVKQAGRPISLSPPDNMQAWVSRATLQKLKDWAAQPKMRFTLQFEYATDKREFMVMFNHQQSPMGGSPVLGFPSHNAKDWFLTELKFVEVVGEAI